MINSQIIDKKVYSLLFLQLHLLQTFSLKTNAIWKLILLNIVEQYSPGTDQAYNNLTDKYLKKVRK